VRARARKRERGEDGERARAQNFACGHEGSDQRPGVSRARDEHVELNCIRYVVCVSVGYGIENWGGRWVRGWEGLERTRIHQSWVPASGASGGALQEGTRGCWRNVQLVRECLLPSRLQLQHCHSSLCALMRCVCHRESARAREREREREREKHVHTRIHACHLGSQAAGDLKNAAPL
jgi:hypothetical protein